MRSILCFSIAFLFCCHPVFGELTARDIEQIRAIVREDVRVIVKEEITASETRMKQYVDAKFEGVDAKFEGVDAKFEGIDRLLTVIVGFVSAMIVLIVVTVGIPQVIMAWRGKSEREQNKKIEELSEEIEALKRRQIVSP